MDTLVGPLMLDIAGTSLSEVERERLTHPLVGGVILFSRNFSAMEQLVELVGSLRALDKPSLLVAVDHEGGRVQRFREGFTRLPPPRWLGRQYAIDPARSRILAATLGWLIGVELQAVGIDFSFTPVVDIDHGLCEVIGDRALHADPEVVAELAYHLMRGLEDTGMVAVAKHFPGHGGVEGDSHCVLPVDSRSLATLEQADLLPFRHLIAQGLKAIMPAHVVYAALDSQPACFSRYWLHEVLRTRMGFNGAILSDDLSMAGAASIGSPLERAQAALQAGCDMLLVCNDTPAADEILDGLGTVHNPQASERLKQLRAQRLYQTEWNALTQSQQWRQVNALMTLC